MTCAPRALLVATVVCENGIGMAKALAAVGFQVSAHCPAFHLFHHVRGLRTFPSSRWRAADASLIRSMKECHPDILLPCDDAAVRRLHRMHGRYPEWAGLIERSLGAPRGFAAAGSRANFMKAMAHGDGTFTPEWTVLHSREELEEHIASGVFPVVLKCENSSGGSGVRIVRSPAMARSAYQELTTPRSRIGRLRRVVQDTVLGITQDATQVSDILLQRYVSGPPANTSVLCSQGKILAAVSVEVMQRSHETGGATVVRRIQMRREGQQMEQAAAKAVELLGLSGFCGFDFILEEGSRRAWLLEMNPRLTPISHLRWAGSQDSRSGDEADLAAALFQACTGRETETRRPSLSEEVVALFPKELEREPGSQYLRGHQHDIPQDDGKLVEACLRRALRRDAYSRMRKFFTSVRNFIPQFMLNLETASPARLENVAEPPEQEAG